jgi:four helix bundle protein
MPHNPQRLLVVQKADVLVVEVHLLAKRHHHRLGTLSPGIRNQLLRAAVSVSANLGESCGPHSPAKAVVFIDVAIGSLNEVERLLRLLQRLGVREVTDPLIDSVIEVRKLAYGFRKRVQQSSPL